MLNALIKLTSTTILVLCGIVLRKIGLSWDVIIFISMSAYYVEIIKELRR